VYRQQEQRVYRQQQARVYRQRHNEKPKKLNHQLSRGSNEFLPSQLIDIYLAIEGGSY
jgi:hypothetical protein